MEEAFEEKAMSANERRFQEWAKLIRKLRWIGMDVLQ